MTITVQMKWIETCPLDSCLYVSTIASLCCMRISNYSSHWKVKCLLSSLSPPCWLVICLHPVEENVLFFLLPFVMLTFPLNVQLTLLEKAYELLPRVSTIITLYLSVFFSSNLLVMYYHVFPFEIEIIRLICFVVSSCIPWNFFSFFFFILLGC